MDLNSLPRNASSLRFSKHNAHVMSLCLTLHVNLSLSLRKTSQALKDLYNIDIKPYMEMCKDIRHTLGMKELYARRKETIERIFGTAKENHGFRYTQMTGKARMEMKVGLTFACMDLKKLANLLQRRGICG